MDVNTEQDGPSTAREALQKLTSEIQSVWHPQDAPNRPKEIPREFLARDLREKRKFRQLSRKLAIFVSFSCVYVAILILDRNISGRSIIRHVLYKDVLEDSSTPNSLDFHDIYSIGSFWRWFQDSFLHVIYDQVNSDGSVRLPHELYTIASHTTIVGGFHLLQTRYQALNTSANSTIGAVCYSDYVPTLDYTCFSSYRDSTASFGWTNGTVNGSYELDQLEAFNYTVTNYTAGFQTYFLRSETEGREEFERAERMKQHKWLDQQTKQVDITMPLYNHNLKIWTIMELKIQFDLAGGVLPKSHLHITSIEPYDWYNRVNVVRSILEIIYTAHVSYFFLLELWNLIVLSNFSFQEYLQRYGRLNALSEWSNILINTLIILWRYIVQTSDARQRMKALESFDEYVHAESLSFWDEVLLTANICNLLQVTGRALKYFQVTNGGHRLMHSVYGSMPEILSFMPIYGCMVLGYTFAGHLLYGLNFHEWSTFSRSLFRVFELNFGLYDPAPIYAAGGVLGAIFIYSSNIVFCILMLNVFMAIVMSTWDFYSAKENAVAEERRKYSRTLGLMELFHVIMLDQDVMDALIEVIDELNYANLVNREMFVKQWEYFATTTTDATWKFIVSWYWTVNETSQSANLKIKPLDLKSQERLDQNPLASNERLTEDVLTKKAVGENKPLNRNRYGVDRVAVEDIDKDSNAE